MKISIVLLLLVQVYLSDSCKQAARYIHKGYAYSRQTLPGAAPSVKIDENGNTSETVRQAAQQYYIYAEMTQPAGVEVQYVWINGKRFKAAVTEVQATPVVLTNPGAALQADTLVAKTPNKVWQIVPEAETGTASEKDSVSKPGTLEEVVLEYLYKGKRHQYTITGIKKLAPVALQ